MFKEKGMDNEKGLVGMLCLRRKEWILSKD